MKCLDKKNSYLYCELVKLLLLLSVNHFFVARAYANGYDGEHGNYSKYTISIQNYSGIDVTTENVNEQYKINNYDNNGKPVGYNVRIKKAINTCAGNYTELPIPHESTHNLWLTNIDSLIMCQNHNTVANQVYIDKNDNSTEVKFKFIHRNDGQGGATGFIFFEEYSTGISKKYVISASMQGNVYYTKSAQKSHYNYMYSLGYIKDGLVLIVKPLDTGSQPYEAIFRLEIRREGYADIYYRFFLKQDNSHPTTKSFETTSAHYPPTLLTTLRNDGYKNHTNEEYSTSADDALTIKMVVPVISVTVVIGIIIFIIFYKKRMGTNSSEDMENALL